LKGLAQAPKALARPSRGAEQLLHRHFRPEDHPCNILEREVARRLREADTLVDAGCGRTAPLLRAFQGKAARLIGVDLVEFSPEARDAGLELIRGDLNLIKLDTGSVDGIVSRSVMEHLSNPDATYKEFSRILKPGGWVIFLTPNLWDYGSLFAKLIPNQFHPMIVAKTEGRDELDTFPTYYRSNTPGAVKRLAKTSGFQIAACKYLGQYPNYLMFSAPLFLLGTWYAKLIGRFEVFKCLRGWLLVTMVKNTDVAYEGHLEKGKNYG
jgi:SAM-dependent methyltransferase